MDFGYSDSLKQLISIPTRTAENTTTLIDHDLTNSPHNITQSGVTELNLFDYELIYCMRKSSKFKSNKHNELNFVEHLKKIVSHKSYSCVNMAYLDFTTKLIDVIDSSYPSKNIRIKGNTKALVWFRSNLTVTKHNACYKKFKSSRLETDKDILRATKIIWKLQFKRKKGCFFKISYRKIQKILQNYENFRTKL